LALGFRLDAWVSPRRVDEGQKRQAEAVGMFHQPQGFAVAGGIGHPKVAVDVVFGVATLLVA
jgi:hypothetical protein